MSQAHALIYGKFIHILNSDEGKMALVISEQKASEQFDMQDLYEEEVPDIRYLDDDGNFYPVSVGEEQEIIADDDCPFIRATAPMLANGKEVGTVLYTDH